MNKFTMSVIATLAAIFGFGAVANAQYGASPFGVTASPTVGPSGPVTITVRGCEPGQSLTATLVDQSDAATCTGVDGPQSSAAGPATGNATMTVTTPKVAGTYTGTVASASVGNNATFTVTVVAQAATRTGSLPQTGSDGIGTTTTIALGLVAVGVGMLVVTQIRRRRTTLG